MQGSELDAVEPSSSTEPVETLESLAIASLGSLSTTERRMLIAASAGQEFEGGAGNEQIAGSSMVQVRSTLLRWLCTDEAAGELIDRRGLRLRDIEIVEKLNLESTQCGFPLRLQRCRLPDGLNLNYAQFPYLQFEDCEIEEMRAVRLRLQASLNITRCKIKRELALQGTSATGHINLSGTTIFNPGHCALNLEGCLVGGNLSIDGECEIHGSINIHSADVHSNIGFACRLIAPRAEYALQIESTRVGGAVLLRRGFVALGQVRLYEVAIEGSLDLQGARLAASRSAALAIEGARVRGSVLLRQDRDTPFQCLGGLRIGRSTIGGNLDMTGARIRSKQLPAADMPDAKVEGRFLAQNAQIRGGLVLVRADIKNDILLSHGTIANPNGPAIRARGLRCGGSLLATSLRAFGEIDLGGSDIRDEFNAHRARLESTGGTAITFAESNIGASADFTHCLAEGSIVLAGARIGGAARFNNCEIHGSLVLQLAKISGHVFLTKARCLNRETTALAANGVRCEASMFAEQFEAVGPVALHSATIGMELILEGASLSSGGGVALNLNRARVGGNLSFLNSRIVGEVAMLEMALEASCDLSKSNVQGRFCLSRSQIGAHLLFKGFECRFRGTSLIVDAVRCSGSVFLTEGVLVEGGVSFSGSEVKADLYADGMQVFGPGNGHLN